MTRIIPILAAVGLWASGCGATVHSSTAAEANLSQYRTFAFFTSPYKQGQPETVAEQQVRADIAQNLERKGLVPATNGQPDVLVAYHLIEQQVPDNTSYFGYSGFCCGQVPVSTYTQGTILVDFIDPHTRTVVWRGTATGVVDHVDHPNLAKLNKAVTKLIDRYPAQLAAVPRYGL